MLTRRRFLQASSALLAGCAVGAPRFASDPFKLGVASGYPRSDRVDENYPDHDHW